MTQDLYDDSDFAKVYLAAEVEAVLGEVVTELEYLVTKHKQSLTSPTTIDWNRAQRLLERLEEKTWRSREKR